VHVQKASIYYYKPSKKFLSRDTIPLKLTTFCWQRMQSQSGSTHSPHRMRKIIMNEWKKSVKFHLESEKKLLVRE
jgi:hypothetical protein